MSFGQRSTCSRSNNYMTNTVNESHLITRLNANLTFEGPVVRIGPNDVSISDPDFVDTIYAPGPGHKRDKDPRKNKALGVNSSVGGSMAHNLHRKRREALNPFFSRQRVECLNPDLNEKVDQLHAVFAQAEKSGEVLNLSDVYYGFTNE